MYTAKGVASIYGGWFGALLFEQTGSWATGFYISAFLALIAAAFAIGLRMAKSPAEVVAAVPATAK
jgi:hypothetical protein